MCICAYYNIIPEKGVRYAYLIHTDGGGNFSRVCMCSDLLSQVLNKRAFIFPVGMALKHPGRKLALEIRGWYTLAT